MNHVTAYEIINWLICIDGRRGRRGRDRMVVGFTTTWVISAYHD